MASLNEIVQFLDRELETEEVPDYPNALNGLQLENRSGEVGRVWAAVDASLAVIESVTAAMDASTDDPSGGILIVHHGLHWQGLQKTTGPTFAKFERAISADLAIYSSHIPLDIHPVWGNNAVLSSALGLEFTQTFFDWKGIELGVRGNFQGDLDALAAKLSDSVGGPVVKSPGCDGASKPGTVGVITGGAGTEVEAIRRAGIDTFITGEGPHWSFPLADEIGLNVLHAGHYATETFGVKTIAAEVASRWSLPHAFADSPTGL